MRLPLASNHIPQSATLSDMGFAGAYRLKSLAASGQKVGFKVYLD
jgi:hypothetical protein